MQCSLVLHGAKEDFYCQSGNAKIMRLSGAKIIFVEEAFKISTAMDNEMDYYKNNGFNPYYIWGGGHTIEGGLAYIEAIANLKEYSENTNWMDYIFLASGTGSTQAGILAGLDKYDFENTETIGISVARKSEYAQKIVNEFYLNLCEHFKIKSYNRKTIVVDDYISGGYGQFNNEIKKISDESIKIYGFTLDTCYTGKAFYGMLDYIKKNNIRDKKILFWHTGGVFNFLAE